MSIYQTLWTLLFPLDGHGGWLPGDDYVEIWAQAVPPHIHEAGPAWDWLPPPVWDGQGTEPWGTPFRAVFICDDVTAKATSRNGQEYVNPVLMLTGEEYERITWVDLWERITDALARRPRPRRRRTQRRAIAALEGWRLISSGKVRR